MFVTFGKNESTIKWPSLSTENGKILHYQRKSLVRLTPTHITRSYNCGQRQTQRRRQILIQTYLMLELQQDAKTKCGNIIRNLRKNVSRSGNKKSFKLSFCNILSLRNPKTCLSFKRVGKNGK